MLCSQQCMLYVDFVPKITARNNAYANDGTKMVQSGHRDLTCRPGCEQKHICIITSWNVLVSFGISWY